MTTCRSSETLRTGFIPPFRVKLSACSDPHTPPILVTTQKPRRARVQQPARRGTDQPASRSDGRSTREAILSAAFRTLIANGYAALNVRDIAREANVNHALINYHFRTKQQLVLEVMAEANRQLLARQTGMYAEDASVSTKWANACKLWETDKASGFVRLKTELMAASFSDAQLRSDYLPQFLGWRRIVDQAVYDALDEFGLELPLSREVLGTIMGCFWVGLESEYALGVEERDGRHLETLEALTQFLRWVEQLPAVRKRARRATATAPAKASSSRKKKGA
jgi:AcrR family transcriptional regulator